MKWSSGKIGHGMIADNDNWLLDRETRQWLEIAAIETLEAIWREIYPPERRNELAARRDWQAIQEKRTF